MTVSLSIEHEILFCFEKLLFIMFTLGLNICLYVPYMEIKLNLFHCDFPNIYLSKHSIEYNFSIIKVNIKDFRMTHSTRTEFFKIMIN